MDIRVYDRILRDLIVFNDALTEENYDNVILSVPPTEPTYPHTIIDEIDNKPFKAYNTPFDKLSSLSYRIDIYAKAIGTTPKNLVARTLAKQIDTYLTNYVGLTQMSYNVSNLENDSTIYHIIMIYMGEYHENKGSIK